MAPRPEPRAERDLPPLGPFAAPKPDPDLFMIDLVVIGLLALFLSVTGLVALAACLARTAS